MPRLEKEARLMKMTTDILTRGGRVLMPVFALGRAQELLLILDEYWEKHPQFQTYPIYYASNLARKCMDVYRTYINTMNDKIKKAMFEGEGRNPWDFRWVRSLKTIDRFEDVGGCVMLASPGMLQVITLLTPGGTHVSSSRYHSFFMRFFPDMSDVTIFSILSGFWGVVRRIRAEHYRSLGSTFRIIDSCTSIRLRIYASLANSFLAVEEILVSSLSP